MKKNIISISGELASGKSTIIKILMEELNYTVYRNGEYFNRSMNIIYKFKNFENYAYDGYFYSLPLLNGKGKRIKFKNITITDYTYETNENGILVITVNDFLVNGKNK